VACGQADRTDPPQPQPPSSTPHVVCVGAAARARSDCAPDPQTITPTVSAAASDRGTPCERTEPLGLVTPCAFGAEHPAATFALIGDSHAGQLRSAFDHVAAAMNWRGYALIRNSCSFVARGRELPQPTFDRCVTFKQQLPQWLRQHPEVSTVFVVGLTRDAGANPAEGSLEAWRTLPKTVTKIVVIRDTPEQRADALACVERAVAAGEPAGTACATPREQALPPDPAVAAAKQIGAPTIDLSRYFCDDANCFPVIGGVLAYKDFTHLTPTFAKTLGPYLLEDVRRIAP
jgi:hypothetical protein